MFPNWALLTYFVVMALFISSLNSGSNGNSYYVGNHKEAVLVDAGISCRSIERRMKQLGLDIHAVKGVFISHEHTDHIKGVETLSKKYQIPVYISGPTLRNSRLNMAHGPVVHFTDKEVIAIGDLQVHVFGKIHDASDPFSFCIRYGEVQVGVFTDIGTCCDNVIRWFRGCHAAFLEANYDEEMLFNGPYPFFLKKRISDGRGHLSNRHAHQLFQKYRPPFMSHLILSHLSQQNNCPDRVAGLFGKDCGKVKVVVASRHEATPVYEIRHHTIAPAKVYTQATLSF